MRVGGEQHSCLLGLRAGLGCALVLYEGEGKFGGRQEMLQETVLSEVRRQQRRPRTPGFGTRGAYGWQCRWVTPVCCPQAVAEIIEVQESCWRLR